MQAYMCLKHALKSLSDKSRTIEEKKIVSKKSFKIKNKTNDAR